MRPGFPLYATIHAIFNYVNAFVLGGKNTAIIPSILYGGQK